MNILLASLPAWFDPVLGVLVVPLVAAAILAIFPGYRISSGLNVAAALQLAQELGPGSTVATVAVDTGFKYLAGDLYRE